MHSTDHVLVVEDDAEMRALTMLMVEEAGVAARGAIHGEEALTLVAAEMPRLILLDMLMPVMDGWQFARRFRERYGNAAPIVVTTAAENARERAEAIGASDVLAKPFDLDQLVSQIRRYVPTATHAPSPAG
jgi:CheY-like chemotaxis protein